MLRMRNTYNGQQYPQYRNGSQVVPKYYLIKLNTILWCFYATHVQSWTKNAILQLEKIKKEALISAPDRPH